MKILDFEEFDKIHGHLQIERVWKDPSKENEILFDDHNVITSGMGVGLSMLFTLSGSDNITDYQFDRFQVGVSGGALNEVSSTFQLSGPLSAVDEYESDATRLLVVEGDQLANGSIINSQAFGMIPFKNVTRINDTSVRYTIVLDDEACNGINRPGVNNDDLNEIGLFMKNPAGHQDTQSILCAYRAFSNITKTNEFSLVFRWTLNF